MSTTTSQYAIAGACLAAEQMLGRRPEYVPVNEQQAQFLRDHYLPCLEEIPGIKGLDTIATADHVTLAQFFTDRGFSFPAQPFNDGEFGTGSVIDVLVKWLTPGLKSKIRKGTTDYPAARLEDDVTIFNVDGHKYPVGKIACESGTDEVCLTRFDGSLEGFDLLNAARRLTPSQQSRWAGYDGLTFPMIDLAQDVDIGWLAGLRTSPQGTPGFEIASAAKKTKLRANEKGARAQAAVNLRFAVTSVPVPRPHLVIDEPFLFWFVRNGVSQPLFAARVTPEDWKEPADIDAE